ncbi:MAG: 16S rRNA (cytidine(1402)-2'-O)-methyltransferase [bacterium]
MELYFVGTPIGNLGDITARALEVLGSVGVVFAEDTRVTGGMLMHFDIKASVMRFDENSTRSDVERLLKIMEERGSAALVTDAGTPNVSDPAFRMIEAATLLYGERVKIIPIPGPSALTAAVSIAHFPVLPFLFKGFPPHKKGREKYFDEIAACETAVVFYESVHRIEACVESMLKRMPERECLIAREITKMFEETFRGSVQEVADKMALKGPRGEYVVVLAPKDWKKTKF